MKALFPTIKGGQISSLLKGLIRSPSNHTNIYPFTRSHPFFLLLFSNIIYSFIYHYDMGRSSWTIEEHIKDHVNQLTMIFQKHDLEKHGIILKCLFFFFGRFNRTSSWTIYISFLTCQLGAFKEFSFRFHINLLI
jgi:hypothetical protein